MTMAAFADKLNLLGKQSILKLVGRNIEVAAICLVHCSQHALVVDLAVLVVVDVSREDIRCVLQVLLIEIERHVEADTEHLDIRRETISFVFTSCRDRDKPAVRLHPAGGDQGAEGE